VLEIVAMLAFYTYLTRHSERLLDTLLKARLKKGKEDALRLDERRGIASLERPDGTLIWIHAASVGEAQSALILIERILKTYPALHILITTGTKTSATRIEKQLPERCMHQYYPLDHPAWVSRFLNHWKPNCVLWLESELWPNMLLTINQHYIPAVLVNARLSPQSARRWRLLKGSIARILSAFSLILTQDISGKTAFESLGARSVIHTGNLKYSARALPHEPTDLHALEASIGTRPVIAYASTHAGEEEMAARIHTQLETQYPNLLSIIIPRHPERGDDIHRALSQQNVLLRGDDKELPDENTRFYIANTLGELGLFYRLSDIVYVGRSLSDDGGGGHNPLEAAMLDCAVLAGRNIQNLHDIYNSMLSRNACIIVENAKDLSAELQRFLGDNDTRNDYAARAKDFAEAQSHVIDTVMEHLAPLLNDLKS